MLEKFVDMLMDWNHGLGVEVNREKIWQKLLDQSENKNSTLQIEPLLFGERHDKLTYASLSNLRHDNLNVGNIFRGICLGLVRNLHSMMGKDLICKLNCERIVATGGALSRNSFLKTCLESEFDYLPIVYTSATDAAYGAAIYAKKLLNYFPNN